MGTTCQRPRGCEARLEEPFFLRRAKKLSEFQDRVFAEKICTLAGRASAHERRGSPVVPALSGESQTEKVTICGAQNKCFLASCQAERERERARERKPATSCSWLYHHWIHKKMNFFIVLEYFSKQGKIYSHEHTFAEVE